MNELFRNITTENYIELVQSFERSKKIFWNDESNKLIHPGEYGEYREDLLKRFLRLYIPENFGISSGFLINSVGDISNQCDIIVYDKERTPRIQNLDNQRFFPIETVLGVGEVKSTIKSIGELNGYLYKLSKLKTLRNSIEDPNPYRRSKYEAPYDPKSIFSDNIFTFLLCYKLDFTLDLDKIDYKDVDFRYWHNMVLSLKDGLLSYMADKSKNLYFSFIKDKPLKFWFLENDKEELPVPIMAFLNGIMHFVNNTTLLEMHVEYYLTEKITKKIE